MADLAGFPYFEVQFTKQGNLAMYEITGLTPGEYSWDVPTVQGKLTLWEITE